MFLNDDDIEGVLLAQAADRAAATRRAAPFDEAQHGAALRAAVRDAVYYLGSVYEATTQCAEDEGFAHDGAADVFAFAEAARYKVELERQERRR